MDMDMDMGLATIANKGLEPTTFGGGIDNNAKHMKAKKENNNNNKKKRDEYPSESGAR